MDNYNQIVREIKNKPSLLAPTSAPAQRNSANSLKASKFQPGEVLSTKINGAKLQEEPGKDGDVIAGLSKGTEVVYLGEQEDGYLHVQAEQGEGWVREFMLQ